MYNFNPSSHLQLQIEKALRRAFKPDNYTCLEGTNTLHYILWPRRGREPIHVWFVYFDSLWERSVTVWIKLPDGRQAVGATLTEALRQL